MTKQHLQVGSLIEKGGITYVVYDWCPNCNIIWCEFWGEKFKLTYSEVNLVQW